MDLTVIIGTTAASLTTSAFLPQVIKAHTSRQVKDLSLLMFVVLTLGLIFWIAYGILTGSLPVIAANSVTLMLSFYIIYLKIKYG
jgi:MtN3 and saliva related transmembrane protein